LEGAAAGSRQQRIGSAELHSGVVAYYSAVRNVFKVSPETYGSVVFVGPGSFGDGELNPLRNTAAPEIDGSRPCHWSLPKLSAGQFDMSLLQQIQLLAENISRRFGEDRGQKVSCRRNSTGAQGRRDPGGRAVESAAIGKLSPY
jgi:hypothetical protein